jgi:hypothetical protein
MGDGGRSSPEGRGLTLLYSIPRGDDFCSGIFLFCFTFSLLHSLVRGARTPRPAHSALPRAEDSLCCGRPAEGRLQDPSPLSFLSRISLWDGWRCHENQIRVKMRKKSVLQAMMQRANNGGVNNV